MEIFADCWLAEDVLAPLPNPSEWKILPHATTDSTTEIAMWAEDTQDAWGGDIQYFFNCVSHTGHDSGWINDPCWTDTGLTSQMLYTYVVRARDERGFVTIDSVPASATAGEEHNPPHPARFATVDPDGINGVPAPSDPCKISMTAAIAIDDEGNGVQYYFECVSPPELGPEYDSDWLDVPTWETGELTIGQTYCYVVRVRDLSSNQNVSDNSDPCCADPCGPNYAPYPTGGAIGDRAEWDPADLPRQWNVYHLMGAVQAVDDEGDRIFYRFTSTNGGPGSNWQTLPPDIGEPGVDYVTNPWHYDANVGATYNYYWIVQYRDDRGNESLPSIELLNIP